MNGDADPNALQQSAGELTEQLLNGEQIDIPTVRELRRANLTQLDLAYALKTTSEWIIEKLSSATAQVALEINAKWAAMHDEESIE